MSTPTVEKEIKPIAMPGIHESFLPFFLKQAAGIQLEVLDVGAGHGAFSQRLFDLGHKVSACDLFPEHFYFEPVVCKKADLTEPLPYEDAQFDAVIALEVMEHILDHEVFFREVRRVLKPGGKLFISTPNVLSLKSRIRFLFTGFYHSFKPLVHENQDGLQHVASLTLDQYNHIAFRAGLEEATVDIDRAQKGSIAWMWLYPFIWLQMKRRKIPLRYNSRKLLLGRIIFLTYKKGDNGS